MGSNLLCMDLILYQLTQKIKDLTPLEALINHRNNNAHLVHRTVYLAVILNRDVAKVYPYFSNRKN